MKTKALITVIILTVTTAYGQSEKFKAAMSANIEKGNSAVSISEFQDVANGFARIAGAEKNEWTPLYYAAFYNLVINFQDTIKERKNKFIALAQKQIESGLKLKPDETEFFVLKVMSYYAEMSLDPMKGMTLFGEANSIISQAKSINPENPRIYLEEAEAVYNMPAEFGGGKEKALPLLLQAKEKFDKFTSSDPLAPSWGKDRCEILIASAKN